MCSRCAEAKFPCEWDKPVHRRKPSTKQKGNLVGSSKPSKLAPLPSAARGELNPAQPTNYLDPVADQGSEDDEYISPDDQTPAQTLTPYRATDHDPLQTALSPNHVVMSNSLVLSAEDIESFQYVPNSLMVLRFGKPWRWSMLSYVHSKIACHEAGVMRAFIAVASMEMRFLELLRFQHSIPTLESLSKTRRLRESAATYLTLALKDLSSVLDRLSSPGRSAQDIDALFSIWFLVIHIGLYDADLVTASHVHLNGIRSFISGYINGNVANEEDKLPPTSQQLLLFIA